MKYVYRLKKERWFFFTKIIIYNDNYKQFNKQKKINWVNYIVILDKSIFMQFFTKLGDYNIYIYFWCTCGENI